MAQLKFRHSSAQYVSKRLLVDKKFSFVIDYSALGDYVVPDRIMNEMKFKSVYAPIFFAGTFNSIFLSVFPILST